MTSNALERPLPSSPDAERAILGAIISDNALIEQAIALTKPSDYYVPSHRWIFTAMLALRERGSEINAVLIGEELKKQGHDPMGEGLYSSMADMQFGVPRTSSIAQYAEIVIGKAQLRSIIRAAYQIAEAALDEEDDAAVIAERATSMMMQIERARHIESDFRPFSEVAIEASSLYEQMHRGVSQAIPTGYASLDQVTRGGIYPGEVRVIMAKTGDGKTANALGSAKFQAAMGIPVGIVSLEMSDLENFFRIHSAMSGVAAWKIKAGIWPDDFHRLQDTIHLPGELPIWVASNARLASIYELRRQVVELVQEHKIRVLYVDYLQLVEAMTDKKNSTRALEVSTITRTLKMLAKELQIGVVELSQPSQEGAKSGKVKTIHNRESTAIGNDADIVIVIDMPEDRENMSGWECTMRIDKHRNGPKMALKFWYDGNTLSFSEDAASAPPPPVYERTRREELDFNS